MSLIVLLLLFGSIRSIESYNVDLTVPLLKSYTGSAQGTNVAFGAAVAIHHAKTKTSLLVGAPKANVTSYDVREGGGIFQCGIDSSETCSFLQLDKTQSFGEVENRTGQLLGQVVKSSGGHLLICAPRYQLQARGVSGNFSYFPIGRCLAYEEDDDLKSENSFIVAPCNALANDPAFSQCESGLSADIFFDNRQSYVGIGTPGSNGGTGDMVYSSWDALELESLNTLEFLQKYSDSDTYQNNIISENLGFSITTGVFRSFSQVDDKQDFAVGTPKFGDYFGGVQILILVRRSQTRVVPDRFTTVTGSSVGSPMGAMFGYAVAAADIDDDSQKLSELIVSAPYHGILNRINVGRIYIFKSDGDSAMSLVSYFEGKQANGLFGLALSSLGDINLDGFADIAVGAPFEDDGVVYVYNGYSGGLRDNPQVIKSSSVPGMMSSFGFSLSKGSDVDSNKYPDFAIGAYKSEKALLLRSRPVVIVGTSVTPNVSSLPLDAADNCVIDQKSTFCFDVGVCVWYEDRSEPASVPSLSIDYTLSLDSRSIENRLVVRDPADSILKSALNGKMDLTPGMANQKCANYTVAVQENFRDKSSAFFISVGATLPVYFTTAPTLAPSAPANSLPDLYPVLDRHNPSLSEARIRIVRNCPLPPADKCTPDLKPSFVSVPNEIVAGSLDLLELNLKVQNNYAESSFRTQLIIGFPPEFVYIDHNLADANTPLLGCVSDDVGAICDIGNPLDPFQEREFRVTLQQKRQATLRGNEGEIVISLNATSEDGDAAGRTHDNFISRKFRVVARADLQLAGFSEILSLIPPPPSDQGSQAELIIDSATLGKILSGKSDNSTVSIGHRYNIRNRGATTVPRITAEFWFPFKERVGTRLIENITATYSLDSDGDCEIIPNEDDQLTVPDTYVECKGNFVCVQVKCDVTQNLVTLNVLSVLIKGNATLDAITQFAFGGSDDFTSDAKLTSYGSARTVSNYTDANAVTASVRTDIIFSIQVQECVQIWLIIVTVIGSLVVLSILIFILYALGFFKMKKKYHVSGEGGGMVAKQQGPQERDASPSSQEEVKKQPEPQYAEAKSPVRSERSSLSSVPPMKEFASEPRRSKASLPPMKEFDDEPRRTSRAGANPPMKEFDDEPRRTSRAGANLPAVQVLDEEPKMRRPSSSGSGGGIPVRQFDQEPRRSVGSGRYSNGFGEPTSPKKPYSETMM